MFLRSGLEQIQSSRAVAKIVQGAVSLRKRALVCFEPLYTYSEFAVTATAIVLLFTLPAVAQKEKRDTLTEVQIDEIREAGNNPPERVGLYTKYLSEHAEAIKALSARAQSAARSREMDDQLQDFTALMDELGSNLDMYSERHADIRKPLKPLGEATQRWLAMLRELKSERGFEVSLKEAVESGEDLASQVASLTIDQAEYFKLHKDEEGQDRAEPK
jgi:hypothetical protein